MRYPDKLLAATLIERRARFSVAVDLEGETVLAHLANSGRLEGLLERGMPALLAPRPPGRRLSHYDLGLIRACGGWVSVDARLPNLLLREALEAGRVRALRDFPQVRAEARTGASRIDFLLSGPGGRCLVETKSVTLVQDGVAWFPDAPTLRGARQLRDLVEAKRAGFEAAVVFVVQREDARELRPNQSVDPAFTKALHLAAGAGVSLLAFRCRVSPPEVELADRIPVRLT